MSTIGKAIQDLEEQRKRIEAALDVLRSLEKGRGPGRPAKRGGGRNISEAGRRRIAEAQKRRWAKVRAARAAQTKKG